MKIYNEKKAAIMVKNGYAGPRRMGLNGTEDSDAILSALCMFEFYAPVCDERLMVRLELVRANTEAESKDQLSDDEIIAQMRYVEYISYFEESLSELP